VVVEDSGSDRPFYRCNNTVVEDRSADELEVTYSLEPVGPGAILRNISVDESEASPRVRRMVDGETVTVHGDPLPAQGQVVRSNGSYYLVTEVGRDDPDWSETTATAARGGLFLIGLGLLRLRWRYGP
jgi:hypothetical protein